MLRKLTWVLLLLTLAACSGGGSAKGGSAAPAAGPATSNEVQLRIQLPPQARALLQRSDELLTSVDVEVVDPGTPDPSTLSGRRLIASGHASVAPGDRSVLVLIQGVPRGTWDIYAFGRSASGEVVARSQPSQLTTGTLALELTLQLVPLGDTALTISPLEPTLAAGTQVLFSAHDQNGLDVTSSVTWSSSDPAVASIDATGAAHALTPGTTTITAVFGTASASTLLTVATATVDALTVTGDSPTVAAGLTVQLHATGTLSDGTTQDLTSSVTWSSSTAFATVNGAGLATGLSVGATDITATFSGLSASAPLNVTPAELTALAVTPTGPSTLTTGFTRQLTATGTFTDGTTADVTESATWSTSDPLAVQISDTAGTKGLATPRNDGTATLTATLLGFSATSVLTGDGRVRFFGARNFAQAGTDMTAARGDWNGDGRTDVAVASAQSVVSYLNTVDAQGLTSFVQSDMDGSGFAPGEVCSLAAGDVNGDGNADLLAVSNGTTNFSFLLGNGDGTFANAVPVAVANFNPRRIVAGDFNEDGIDDVAVTVQGPLGPGAPDAVEIFTGTVAGPVGPSVPVTVGDNPWGLALANFNNDGHIDLAISNLESNNVMPLLGNGLGGFSIGTFQTAGTFPADLAVADFNGDGNDDVAVVNSTTSSFTFFPGNGAGSLLPGSNVALASNAVGIAAGDFDGDGLQDVAASLNRDLSLSVLSGNGDGTFQAGVGRPLSGLATYAVNSNGTALIADFDLDGVLDAVVAHVSSYFSFVQSLQSALALTTGIGPNRSKADLAAGDLNGDGFDDLAVCNSGDNTVSVLLGDGAGGFSNPPGNPYPIPADGFSLKLGDMNNDGRPDVVVNHVAATQLVSVSLTNPDGSLQAPFTQSTGLPSNEVRLGDFNNDGNLDAVVGFAGPAPNVELLLGNGTGALAAPTNSAAGNGVTSLAVADFNRDGNLDVAVPELGPGANIGIFNGTGGNTLPATPSQTIVTAFTGLFELLSADFDGDGFADLATFTPGLSNSDVSVFFNRGDGTFSNVPDVVIQDVAFSPWRCLQPAPDMDQNGLPDIVVQDNTAGGLRVYLSHADRTFTFSGSIMDGDITGLAAGQFNGDPRPDLASCGGSVFGAPGRVLLNLQQILSP